jgi:hypothetical protein
MEYGEIPRFSGPISGTQAAFSAYNRANIVPQGKKSIPVDLPPRRMFPFRGGKPPALYRAVLW